VTFRYWVRVRDVEYGHAEKGINMFFISSLLINSKYPSNIHIKQLIVRIGP